MNEAMRTLSQSFVLTVLIIVWSGLLIGMAIKAIAFIQNVIRKPALQTANLPSVKILVPERKQLPQYDETPALIATKPQGAQPSHLYKVTITRFVVVQDEHAARNLAAEGEKLAQVERIEKPASLYDLPAFWRSSLLFGSVPEQTVGQYLSAPVFVVAEDQHLEAQYEDQVCGMMVE